MAKHPAEFLNEYAATATSEDIRATMKIVAPEFEDVIAYYRKRAEDPTFDVEGLLDPTPSKSPQVSPGIGNGRSASLSPPSTGDSGGEEQQ
jgi:hypothetical protein